MLLVQQRGHVLKFTWEQVVSTTPNLTLTLGHDTAGRYYCRASVLGFADIGAEATVYMKGPPTIISHRTQFGIPGDNVRLECSAFSIPAPQRVVWSFKGEDIGSDLDYSVSLVYVDVSHLLNNSVKIWWVLVLYFQEGNIYSNPFITVYKSASVLITELCQM